VAAFAVFMAATVVAPVLPVGGATLESCSASTST
jgi:hypothetical protein